MRFNPPSKWFGFGDKVGERWIAPRSWEGVVLLLLFIAGCGLGVTLLS
jgi:hypothetical protein